MSVCFFLPADQASVATSAEELKAECVIEDNSASEGIHDNLQHFWAKVNDDMKKINADDFKTQVLPLARIKKIMKLDEEVKMISAEAPVLFAKAAEIFIHELTLRAWSHTEDNKRRTLQVVEPIAAEIFIHELTLRAWSHTEDNKTRTLQRNDIAMAISKSDQFDFLIDIVPRHEVKAGKPREEPPRHTHTHTHNTEQVSHQQSSTIHNSQPQFVIQPCAQLVQQQATSSAASAAPSAQQPVTLVQQVVTSSGEVQQLPIQLTQAQMNMIRLQMQNNPSQPIIIQAQPQQSPQIIQVSSQAHQPQQVFLAQVSQDDS